MGVGWGGGRATVAVIATRLKNGWSGFLPLLFLSGLLCSSPGK